MHPRQTFVGVEPGNSDTNVKSLSSVLSDTEHTDTALYYVLKWFNGLMSMFTD